MAVEDSFPLSLELHFEAPEAAAGHKIVVNKEAVLGRSPDCDIHIQDRRVSRRHAKIFCMAQTWLIEDLESPNGTTVNGRRIHRHPLKQDDLVGVGACRVRVDFPGRKKDSLVEPVIKPVDALKTPNFNELNRKTFFQAIGLGGETVLDISSPEKLLEQTRHFAVLHEVSRTLTASHSPQAMLAELLDVVLNVSDGDRAFVALAARDTTSSESQGEPDTQFHVNMFRTRARSSDEPPPGLSKTVVNHVLAARCAVLSHNPEIDARFSSADSLFMSRTRAFMAVPILLGETLLGAIVVESNTTEAFSEPELDLLTLIAFMAGQTLENLRLAERREEMIADLQRAHEELVATQTQLIRSEQLAVLGRLSSGLAHEVNNHLSPFTLANVIARKYPADQEIQMAMEMMLEARQHIVDLVSEVKNFARGAQDSASRREPADVAQLCQAVVQFAQCDPVIKQHSLEVDVESEAWANMDVARIRQVLMNLIKNAADALGQNLGQIRIKISESDTWAAIEVIDNGPGISAELGERIFEPFVSTKGESGLGLGLDISRKIVRAHGGELNFSSEIGRGTTFRIYLPALSD